MSSLLLTIDIGNTNITLGAFDESALVKLWRLSLDMRRTTEETFLLISGIMAADGIDKTHFQDAVICSVVPNMTSVVRDAVWHFIDKEPLVITPGVRTGVKINYDRAHDVGTDRIMDAVAVNALYSTPAVVVDIGTATVFNAITKRADGTGVDYIGGAIAPGLQMSMEGLNNRTAMLRRVELQTPDSPVGRSTVTSIQSGLIYGFADLTNGMIRRFRKELSPGDPESCKVVATGGMLVYLHSHLHEVDVVDEALTLKGLQVTYAMNEANN